MKVFSYSSTLACLSIWLIFFFYIEIISFDCGKFLIFAFFPIKSAFFFFLQKVDILKIQMCGGRPSEVGKKNIQHRVSMKKYVFRFIIFSEIFYWILFSTKLYAEEVYYGEICKCYTFLALVTTVTIARKYSNQTLWFVVCDGFSSQKIALNRLVDV